jgi:hypothetical protein
VAEPPAKVPLAPVAGAVKVTLTPETRLPPLSFTVACNAVPNAMLIVALCGVPAVAVSMGGVPVPERPTVCGLPGALSLKATPATRVPGPAGENVTVTAQLAFAASVVPHVPVEVKSPAFVPVTEMLVMLKVAFPVLFRVTV